MFSLEKGKNNVSVNFLKEGKTKSKCKKGDFKVVDDESKKELPLIGNQSISLLSIVLTKEDDFILQTFIMHYDY